MPPTRRAFLHTSAATVGALAAGAAEPVKPIKVVVWDEQQPQQKQAYDNFLGNWIAKYLEARPGLEVQSVKLNDPEQGLSGAVLGPCDVLIWWGHVRQGEVKPETGRKIVERIKAGSLSLISLHSAHWSTPFVEAMWERTRQDAVRTFAAGKDKVELEFTPAKLYTVPKADARITPYAVQRKFPDGSMKVAVQLPNCCFPAYRADGKPSQVRVLKPEHPIARDVPKEFELPHTEMYDEPFHVPTPDASVFEERWDKGGEHFRSGSVWKVGKGKVVYFRPGHETFGVYLQPLPLQIIANATVWLAAELPK